jgi:hypothetical protein
MYSDPISTEGRGQFGNDPSLSPNPARSSKIYPSVCGRVSLANNSAIRQTGQAAHKRSGKMKEILRDSDHTSMSSLSKHHLIRNVDEDNTYTQWKQFATDSRADEEVRKWYQSSQTVPETEKSGLTPANDGNKKFPCSYCTKTYLHANHLKRHLLQRKLDTLSRP